MDENVDKAERGSPAWQKRVLKNMKSSGRVGGIMMPMPHEAFVHEDLWSELPIDEHASARAKMQALARLDTLKSSPQAARLAESEYDGSYRLRFGRYRIHLLHLADEKAILFTTAFLKRRESDYDAAIERHDARVRAYE